MLRHLVDGAGAVLGDNFIGAYLQGSFATGDWDIDSDVDFVIVIEHEVPEAQVPALQALHARVYDLDSNWAKHLEGSYFPKEILARSDASGQPLLYLDNGSRELVLSEHCNTHVVRWVLREHGIAMAGPAPVLLIDPVPADGLRREVLATMHAWADEIFANPEAMNNRWYQPYAVLSYCRMLHTLQTGRVVSKPAGAAWAKGALDPRWVGLIDRAWAQRPDPSLKIRQKADPEDFAATLEFVRYALEVGQRHG